MCNSISINPPLHPPVAIMLGAMNAARRLRILGNVIKKRYIYNFHPQQYSIIIRYISCMVRSICAAISYSNAPQLCSGLFPQVVFFFFVNAARSFSRRFSIMCGGALNDEYFALIRKLFHPCMLHAQSPPAAQVPGEFFVCWHFAANYCNKNLSIRDITRADMCVC